MPAYRLSPDQYPAKNGRPGGTGFASRTTHCQRWILRPTRLAALHRGRHCGPFRRGLRHRGPVEARRSGWGRGPEAELAAVPVHPALAELFQAVTEQRVAEFTLWRSAPLIGALDSGLRPRPLVRGSDTTEGGKDKRTFRVDRIEGDMSLGSPGGFQQREGTTGWAPFQPWKFGSGPAVNRPVERLIPNQAVWAAPAARPRALGEGIPTARLCSR